MEGRKGGLGAQLFSRLSKINLRNFKILPALSAFFARLKQRVSRAGSFNVKDKGRKGRLWRSLRLRLCICISIIGVIFAGIFCVRSYHEGLEEIEAYVDEELSQIASVVIDYNLLIPQRWESPFFKGGAVAPQESYLSRHGMRGGQASGPVPSLGDLFFRHQEIIIAPIYSNPGEPLYLPSGVGDGFYTILIADKRVRAYVATNHSGVRFVVARPMALVESLATRALMSIVFEFIFLICIFIPSAVVLISLMFKPVRRLAHSIYQREKSDLSPIKAKVPSELDPLIHSLNRLFRLTHESIRNERRFIADAAHEMRTPLTALSLKVQNFDEEGLTQEQLKKLYGIRDAIRNQQALTNSLLTLARARCAEGGLKYEKVDVKELFIDILDNLGELADAKDLDLGVLKTDVLTVVSLRAQLKTILMNLCSNAIKYTPDGGTIDLVSERAPGGCILSVLDTGPGIPPEDLKKVFEPFYRVGGDTSRIQGTGLGLAIVKSTCNEIGTSCVFSNRPEGGLCAQVFVPARELA